MASSRTETRLRSQRIGGRGRIGAPGARKEIGYDEALRWRRAGRSALKATGLTKRQRTAAVKVSTMSASREAHQAEAVDSIISWPSVTGGELAAAISKMQRLNPGLGLRRAISTWAPDESKLSASAAAAMRKDIEESGPSEFLVYGGSALDIVTIVMPEPPSDDSMSGFGDLNRERGTHETDLGDFRYVPRRIERSAEGHLVIRPRSRAVDETADWFAAMYQSRFEKRRKVDEVWQFQARWGIFRDPYEQWEVKFAYHRPGFMEAPMHFTDSNKRNYVFWRTIPVGTICYIDRYDFPLDDHYERARAIVAAGTDFAIVVNIEIAEARLFRADGVQTFTDGFRIPEWHWFAVPVRAG